MNTLRFGLQNGRIDAGMALAGKISDLPVPGDEQLFFIKPMVGGSDQFIDRVDLVGLGAEIADEEIATGLVNVLRPR
ncbi:hypothetical protein [Polaromonas sp. AER18D-145]|uniref:hypothetical protein n=1 Tax=Polaromonas sp. AER18D-145 TaxID=1977060 RepID=UPI001F0B48ED|nr:hypothetical protein [Polaromonas sp. AER18D-145]